MPATPKSPKSAMARKIQVTPLQNRPKGAVRAKSGCYTCRIRRKKCDERRIGDEAGPCETCKRLKLECLGFGAKRPDWLRDTHRVAEIRDRIKAHLAAQGMIKGHAGSGARMQVQDDILRLSDPRDARDLGMDGARGYGSGTSSSGGSPGREDSMESDRPYGNHRLAPYNHQQISSLHSTYPYAYNDPYGQADMLSSRCDSPSDSMMGHPYEYPDQPLYLPDQPFDTPARKSLLSTLYHAHFTIDPEPDTIYDPANPSPSIILPSQVLPFELINQSMREYVNNIVKIQYLLGDKSTLPNMIWEAVISHIPSQEAVNLLSLTYYTRQENRETRMLQNGTIKNRITGLKNMLVASGSLTADDAMAALHVVSLYLFDGGRGRWDEFLTFACTYTRSVLRNPLHYNNSVLALEAANEKDQFVVKTTIWFDVLASITTRRPPILIKFIRELFSPHQSWVGSPPTYSMMSPMGCENTVVWALAEASELSYWKARHEASGDLSVRQLVSLVQEIEPFLQAGPRPIQSHQTPEAWSRYLASEIFRTSTKLFLKSVESGDYPHVTEIKQCVKETLAAIREFPTGTVDLQSAVVRSTVFGIFLCGSLTDNEDVLRYLKSHLQQNSGHEGVGNCVAISGLLEELWELRKSQATSLPVQWRHLLAKNQILLV